MKKRAAIVICAVAALVAAAGEPAHAMHIADGILPFKWAAVWFAASAPFMMWGLRDLRVRSGDSPHYKTLVGMVGAAVFIISCMPIPVPFAGTCSHPCGTGLAAIIIGPAVTVVIASVALIFQALFLAHGGLSTLGADIFSMGVAGAFAGYAVFKLCVKLRVPVFAAAFLAGVVSDWATYAVTSLELATALNTTGSAAAMFVSILIAFMPTQIPLGIFEGFLSAGAYRFISGRRPDLFAAGGIVKAMSLAGIVVLTMALVCARPAAALADWDGVDKTVVEKYANEAGRPAREPLINTDRGDMLLFVFLLAGTAGGFAMGYTFRKLFYEKKDGGGKAGND